MMILIAQTFRKHWIHIGQRNPVTLRTAKQNKAVVDNQIRAESFRGSACFDVTDLVFESHSALAYLAPHLRRWASGSACKMLRRGLILSSVDVEPLRMEWVTGRRF